MTTTPPPHHFPAPAPFPAQVQSMMLVLQRHVPQTGTAAQPSPFGPNAPGAAPPASSQQQAHQTMGAGESPGALPPLAGSLSGGLSGPYLTTSWQGVDWSSPASSPTRTSMAAGGLQVCVGVWLCIMPPAWPAVPHSSVDALNGLDGLQVLRAQGAHNRLEAIPCLIGQQHLAVAGCAAHAFIPCCLSFLTAAAGQRHVGHSPAAAHGRQRLHLVRPFGAAPAQHALTAAAAQHGCWYGCWYGWRHGWRHGHGLWP